jgi:hypothetical protein
MQPPFFSLAQQGVRTYATHVASCCRAFPWRPMQGHATEVKPYESAMLSVMRYLEGQTTGAIIEMVVQPLLEGPRGTCIYTRTLYVRGLMVTPYCS